MSEWRALCVVLCVGGNCVRCSVLFHIVNDNSVVKKQEKRGREGGRGGVSLVFIGIAL